MVSDDLPPEVLASLGRGLLGLLENLSSLRSMGISVAGFDDENPTAKNLMSAAQERDIELTVRP